MASTKIENEFKGLFRIGLVAVLLFFLNIGGIKQPLQSLFSYTLQSPLSAINADGENIGEYFKDLARTQAVKNENLELRARVAQLEAQVEKTAPIYEENTTLRQQLKLGNSEKNVILVKLFTTNAARQDNSNIYINKGAKDGVSEGDAVVLGDTLVGYVGLTQPRRALLKPLSDKTVSNEGFVVNDGTGEHNTVRVTADLIEQSKLIKGVVVGTGKNIQLENVDINANIDVGDPVFVRDSQTGEMYYIGRISNVHASSTATAQVAEISPIVNLEDLISAFVVLNQE